MTRKAWIALGGVSTLALLLAVALVVSLATGDDDPGHDGPVVPDASDMEAFQECMSDQGVDPPGPGGLPGEGLPDGFDEALEACADVAPRGFGPPGGGHVVPFGAPG